MPVSSGSPPFRSVLHGVPFQEQDGVVGSCAHVCVRGSLGLLAANYTSVHALTFPEISTAAGVPDASQGLTYAQIMLALQSGGCTVHAYQGGEFGLDQIAYYYNESGFPVILGIKTDEDVGHALLILGHEFDPHAWWPDAGPGYFPSLGDGREWFSSALWTGNFVVHDDNFGPYLNVHHSVIRNSGVVAIVPIPNCIDLRYDMLVAEAIAALVLSDTEVINHLKSRSKSRWTDALLGKDESVPPVLRTRLLQSADVRQHIEMSGYPPRVRTAYHNTPLPKWVYLVEVSVASMYGAMLKLGEIILDPSIDVVSAPDRGPETIRIIHLPGMYWHMPFTTTDAPVFVDTDRPTRLFCRPTFQELSSSC